MVQTSRPVRICGANYSSASRVHGRMSVSGKPAGTTLQHAAPGMSAVSAQAYLSVLSIGCPKHFPDGVLTAVAWRLMVYPTETTTELLM